MRYEVLLNIKVDKDANFLEVDDMENCRVIQEMIKDIIYDIDDVKVLNCVVEMNDKRN